MTPGQRVKYFRDFWPAACAANGWSPKDDAKRKAVTLEAMACVRGPQVSSSHADFGPDEVTALFCYLDHLARQADLDRAARWVDCQQDYQAFNRARQADWHEAKMFGGRKNKLTRDRFGGQASAVGDPLEKFDPAAIRKRHMTMANRHQARQRNGQPDAGQILASTAPVMAGEDPF